MDVAARSLAYRERAHEIWAKSKAFDKVLNNPIPVAALAVIRSFLLVTSDSYAAFWPQETYFKQIERSQRFEYSARLGANAKLHKTYLVIYCALKALFKKNATLINLHLPEMMRREFFPNQARWGPYPTEKNFEDEFYRRSPQSKSLVVKIFFNAMSDSTPMIWKSGDAVSSSNFDEVVRAHKQSKGKYAEDFVLFELFKHNVQSVSKVFSFLVESRQVTSLPRGLVFLGGLKVLSLRKCSLKQLPDFIGNLDNLEILNVDDNQLTRLPAALCSLSKLKKLEVSGNKLTHLPGCMSQLTKLKELHARSNQLHHLPLSGARLRGFEIVDITGNPILFFPQGCPLALRVEKRCGRLSVMSRINSMGGAAKLRRMI